jgi:hypothetical protein
MLGFFRKKKPARTNSLKTFLIKLGCWNNANMYLKWHPIVHASHAHFQIFCPLLCPNTKAHFPFKGSVFSDITPCSLLKVNRRFGEIFRLHLQVRKLSHARNLHCLLPAGFLLALFFDLDVGKYIFLGNVLLFSTISHQIEDFIITAVGTSYPMLPAVWALYFPNTHLLLTFRRGSNCYCLESFRWTKFLLLSSRKEYRLSQYAHLFYVSFYLSLSECMNYLK